MDLASYVLAAGMVEEHLQDSHELVHLVARRDPVDYLLLLPLATLFTVPLEVLLLGLGEDATDVIELCLPTVEPTMHH